MLDRRITVRLYAALLMGVSIAHAQREPCSAGAAAGYPCDKVDLLAFMHKDTIGGGSLNDCWGWTDPQTGKEYALVGRTSGTSFIDISSATNPVYLGNLPTHSSNNSWRDIKVYQDHAFIVSDFTGNHGMQIFDLTQLRNVTNGPVTFSNTAHYAGFGSSHNIVINEQSGYAYAVGISTGGTNCGTGLHIMNIQTPTNPVFVGCFSADGYTHDAQCVTYSGPDPDHQGKEICFCYNEDTLTIVDVLTPSGAVQLARMSYPDSWYTHQGWATEDHRYVLFDDETDETSGGASQTRTHIVDVGDLDSPAYMGFYEHSTPAQDHNLYILSNYVYQANYRSGLRMLDLVDIANTNLVQVGYFDTYPADDNTGYQGTWSVYPYFESGVVIASSIGEGLFILLPNVSAAPVLNMAVTVTQSTDVVLSTNRHHYGVVVTNQGPDAAPLVEVSIAMPPGLSLALIDQLDDDGTASGFGGGQHAGTQWSTSNQWLEIDPVALGVGVFTSRVIDAGADVDWSALAWLPLHPYGKELPDDSFAETGYADDDGGKSPTADDPDAAAGPGYAIQLHPDPAGKGRSFSRMLLHLNESPATNGSVIAESSTVGAAASLATGEPGVDKSVPGVFRTAIGLDGVDDMITISNTIFTVGESNRAYTVSAWIKTSSNGTILAQYAAADSNRFEWAVDSGRLVYRKGGSNLVVSSSSVSDGEWHHIALRRTEGNTIDLFIDGADTGSAVDSNLYAQAVLTLGGASSNSGHWAGCLDEVAVYETDLSQHEIEDLFRRGVLYLGIQLRSCDDPACDGESFVGPDGTTNSMYSELLNPTPSPPSLVISNLPSNRYVQHRVFLSTSLSNYGPRLLSVSLGPDHYDSDVGTIVSSQGACSGLDPVICALGTISNQSSAAIEIDLVIATNIVGFQTNNAAVDGEYLDFVTSDDTDAAVVDVVDSDADGTPDFFDLDDDADGMPDDWENQHGFNQTNAADAAVDTDNDGIENLAEFIADTHPIDRDSFFRVERVTRQIAVAISFLSSTARVYTLQYSDSLAPSTWTNDAGTVDVPGNGGSHTVTNMPGASNRVYRLQVELP